MRLPGGTPAIVTPAIVVLAAAAGLAAIAGCRAPAEPPGRAPTGPTGTAPVGTAPVGPVDAQADARAQLAGLAAAARDRPMVAYYTLVGRDRPDRMVAVTLAADGTWRVDIPAGALGGTADIAMAGGGTGVYQCTVSPASGPGGCVRVAPPGGSLPAAVDPRIWHVFADWPEVLTDRRAPLSVAHAPAPPPWVAGTCYSVEPISASLVAAVDAGIYCYAPDGTLTGAVSGFGTLTLASVPSAGPPTVPLPGPVVAGPPLPTAALSGPAPPSGGP